MSLSRRELLGTGAGLIIAFHLPRTGRAAQAQPKKPKTDPNAFVRIAPDETVTVQLGHSEMGQGNWTGLAMLIAEELDCDWSKMRVEHAPAEQTYAHLEFGIMAVGGSSTMRSEYDRYREVGAMARDMLVRAAAAEWKTSPRKLRTENGFVLDGAKKLSYGRLAEAARKLPPPKEVKLKPKEQWKYIGKEVRRLDSPEKTTGRAQFGMDVRFEGLRTALVARSPVFGGRVKSFDPGAAKAVKGVEQIVQVPTGVAVVAADFWAAKRGRDALRIEWDPGEGAELDSEKLKARYLELSKKPGDKAAARGDVEASLASAAKRIEAVYELPYLAHATMEPLNCTVKPGNGEAEVWVGTQFQQIDQAALAAVLGVPQAKVKLHTPFLGGGFGRRGSPRSDFVKEAAEVAKAAGVPVKVVWTREDDMRGGFYRPAFVHRIEAGLDEKGNLVAWKQTAVGQSIMKGTMFEKMMVKDGIDPTSVEGAADSPYLEKVAHLVTLHTTENPVPVHFWRSVGHTHTAFAVESMIDELAHATGRDPLEFRLGLLADRPARLLKAAAELGGWSTPLAKGRARGLAVHESFGSFVAQCAEVSIEGKEIHVHEVAAAVDCGQAVNPLAVEAQVQGSIVYGLTAALRGEITLEGGQPQQSNFHDYPMLRLPEMPRVRVKILDSGEKMGGIGEPATPPIAPAVANAVFALTGQRLRALPMRLA